MSDKYKCMIGHHDWESVEHTVRVSFLHTCTEITIKHRVCLRCEKTDTGITSYKTLTIERQDQAKRVLKRLFNRLHPGGESVVVISSNPPEEVRVP
jgi:hypothetical protein